MTNILGISGSLRAGSFNTMLLKEAARLFEGANFTLADIRMPLYDGDEEEKNGAPIEAEKLAEQIANADAVVISTPEYNGGISGSLNNALDWISRSKPQPLAGKPVAIMSASAGRTGGTLGQFALRSQLTAFDPKILQSPQVMVAGVFTAFDDQARLNDVQSQELLTALMVNLKASI